MSAYLAPKISSIFNVSYFSGSPYSYLYGVTGDIETNTASIETNTALTGAHPRVLIQEGITIDGKTYNATNYVSVSDTAYTTQKSLCPLLTAGQFVYTPTSAVTIKMSSSSTSDTNQTFIVVGYDSTVTNVVTDIVILTGQTPASGLFGTQFARIIGAQVIGGTNGTPGGCTAGNIYLVQGGYSSFTAGVPNDLTQCFSTAVAGAGTLFSPVLSYPNGTKVYYTDLVMNGYNIISGASEIIFNFYVRNLSLSQSNTMPWKLVVSEMVSSNNPFAYLHQESFSDIGLDTTGSSFSELQVCVRRIGGNNNTATVFCNLTGTTVKSV